MVYYKNCVASKWIQNGSANISAVQEYFVNASSALAIFCDKNTHVRMKTGLVAAVKRPRSLSYFLFDPYPNIAGLRGKRIRSLALFSRMWAQFSCRLNAPIDAFKLLNYSLQEVYIDSKRVWISYTDSHQSQFLCSLPRCFDGEI